MENNWMSSRLQNDVQKAVNRHCANAVNGQCLLLGKQCFYFRELDSGEQTQRCNYFHEAVIDNDQVVKQQYETALNRYLGSDSGHSHEQTADCQDCGKPFVKRNNRQSRCSKCQALADRRLKNARQRRYREKLRQSPSKE